ncbi:hypothetical protein X798_00166 [Onchocerca flexuosa]|uniref:Uncharacterized protein n=1 Tax=Onchocerca flexuosa TaxID=387005 RepID=A0A238C602_9BILA|nr:hypothetical protein X798_00166 [Onchocerca flexuosa]
MIPVIHLICLLCDRHYSCYNLLRRSEKSSPLFLLSRELRQEYEKCPRNKKSVMDRSDAVIDTETMSTPVINCRNRRMRGKENLIAERPRITPKSQWIETTKKLQVTIQKYNETFNMQIL